LKIVKTSHEKESADGSAQPRRHREALFVFPLAWSKSCSSNAAAFVILALSTIVPGASHVGGRASPQIFIDE